MTPNKEDYLKCIYEIGTHAEKITNKEIAAQMQVSPPAVTEMIKKINSKRQDQGVFIDQSWAPSCL